MILQTEEEGDRRQGKKRKIRGREGCPAVASSSFSCRFWQGCRTEPVLVKAKEAYPGDEERRPCYIPLRECALCPKMFTSALGARALSSQEGSEKGEEKCSEHGLGERGLHLHQGLPQQTSACQEELSLLGYSWMLKKSAKRVVMTSYSGSSPINLILCNGRCWKTLIYSFLGWKQIRSKRC